MSALRQEEEFPYVTEEHSFSGSLAYLRMLVALHPGTIEFRTGAGHIIFDLIKFFPDIDGYSDEKLELCHLIEEHVYPLTASLYAQAVAMKITIAQTPLGPPHPVKALGSFTALDSEYGILRHGFLSPHHVMNDLAKLSIASGVTVECEPLNYHYHQLIDDRVPLPENAASNLLTHAYAGRDKDPLTGYREDRKPLPDAPRLETKAIPRWLLDGERREIMPRVSGANGATHVPAYIRLLRVSPQNHLREEAVHPDWRWSPSRETKTSLGIKARPVSQIMAEPEPEPHEPKPLYLKFHVPAYEPGWYRPE